MLPYLIQNQDITNLSGYRTKALARYFFELKTLEDIAKIREIQDFANKENLKIEYIWWGMNVFFAFDVFNWIIIKNCLKGFEVNLTPSPSPRVERGAKLPEVLEVYSGENMIYLVSRLNKDLGNNTLKPWCHLPGTVGWAIVGNAGCFWLEIVDIFISARIYDLEENRIFEADKEFMDFGYRSSVFKRTKKYFIISAKFDISTEKDNFYTDDFRAKNQPKWFNCGSVFRNPEWFFAGKLIEDLGLKWTKIGGAEISPMHANFVVSDWTASYQDILELISFIKKVVFEKFSIELCEEINIISN